MLSKCPSFLCHRQAKVRVCVIRWVQAKEMMPDSRKMRRIGAYKISKTAKISKAAKTASEIP